MQCAGFFETLCRIKIHSNSHNNRFLALGFGRSDKDSEREKMLDPVNDGEDEDDEEGLSVVLTQI